MKFSIAALGLAALLLTGCTMPQGHAAGNLDSTSTSVGQASAVTESGATRLTKEQAEAIALEHAGFTADQVRRLRTEFEIDDGVPRYEVQFRQGRWEYDYEIHAETGAILSYDRDD